MACVSAPQLNFFPWITRESHPHLLCPYQRHSSFQARNNRTAHFTCQHPLLKASLSPSSQIELETAKKKTVSTLRELCHGHVPEHIMGRIEELGYVEPTEVQKEALPLLFAGYDCVLHAQTGSGKTLAYLLRIFSVVNSQRSSVQALIVVPNRELGIQVTKVARLVASKSEGHNSEQKECSIMPLLDGGSLKRHRSWLKAEPPTIVIATLGGISQMLERHVLTLNAMKVLVVDEVDFMFNSSKHVSALRKLLTSYSCTKLRQTVLVSATIPQHRRFVYEAVQQKWTKVDVVHVHVNPIMPLPSSLHHRFVVCRKGEKYHTLLSLLKSDKPNSAIVFVSMQSEKSKKDGNAPTTTSVKEFLESSLMGFRRISLLEEEMSFNQRASSLTELRQGGGGYLLVATDIAARGIDLPETTHVYNFDLPNDAVSYLHRAGRTGRNPFSDDKCYATSIITPGEQFVLQRFENELMFSCEQLFLYS